MKINKEKINEITHGIFSYASDFFIWMLVYNSELLTLRPYGVFYRAAKEADRVVEQFHTEGWKTLFVTATKTARNAGYIKKTEKGKRVNPEITEEGKKRLAEILPHYDPQRIWDKKLYLVTYDISESRKKDRELLRSMLKRLGMGMLQESVFITPYNPKEVLKQFLKERYLSGSVIISDIGQDGAIGEEDILGLVKRVYKLDSLNERYENFLKNVKENPQDPFLPLSFLAILKDDPQLPFELLPQDWKGEEAYKVYQELRKGNNKVV